MQIDKENSTSLHTDLGSLSYCAIISPRLGAEVHLLCWVSKLVGHPGWGDFFWGNRTNNLAKFLPEKEKNRLKQDFWVAMGIETFQTMRSVLEAGAESRELSLSFETIGGQIIAVGIHIEGEEEAIASFWVFLKDMIYLYTGREMKI